MQQPTWSPAERTEPHTSLRRAIDAGVENLRRRQEPDGHWAGDYGGPLFLLPGLLIALRIGETTISDARQRGMRRYLESVQNADGGYGLHIEDRSTVLGTALNYVALRILGAEADDPAAQRARNRLRALGGAEGIPTWGKFWLAVLGVYHWDGVPPLLPELYLLPRAFPLHPGNLLCHTRQVFLPMCYVYGRRYTGPIDPLVRALREEMLVERYDEIAWTSLRERVASVDVHSPHTPLLRLLNRGIALYEKRPSKRLRDRALEVTLDHIRHEDEATSYLTIGPVSKAMHTVIAWFEDPGSEAFAQHVARVSDYLWDGPDGTKMQGYNGSQLWDAAFAMLAVLESDLPDDEGAYLDVLDNAHCFIDSEQVRDDIVDGADHYRDPIRGSWPFSTREQTWTVSDCTAEALKAAVRMQPHAVRPLSTSRMRDAVDFLLAGQNADGGWSEYERSRAPAWAEHFNAAEVFGPIMRAYSYVECTSACIQALLAFQTHDAAYRRNHIAQAIEGGLSFARSVQRDDGGWIGGWGLCFSYGTWFGVDALAAGGRVEDRPRIERATRYLLEKQRTDGGFSESYQSSVEARWVDGDDSYPVQTAWALNAIMTAHTVTPLGTAHRNAIDRGVAFLLARQTHEGDWPQTAISGVFNRTCMIHYDNYRHVMPLWALSRYRRLFAR